MADVKEALGLLEEIRVDPGKYLPLVDHAWQEFPAVDYGENWYDDPWYNIGWDAGLLEGKRPYFLECWSTCGITMLTYFVSAEGLGRYGQKKAVKLLEEAGLFRILDPENPRTSVMEFRDGSGRRFYSVNVAVGDENGTYAAGGRCRPFSALNRYNRKRKKEAG